MRSARSGRVPDSGPCPPLFPRSDGEATKAGNTRNEWVQETASPFHSVFALSRPSISDSGLFPSIDTAAGKPIIMRLGIAMNRLAPFQAAMRVVSQGRPFHFSRGDSEAGGIMKYTSVFAISLGLLLAGIALADSLNVRRVGNCSTPGWALGVEVEGNYAYVADHVHGMRVISIQDPAHPTEVGHCDQLERARSQGPSYNLGRAYNLAVAGNFACVAAHSAGLRIISVSNPTSPAEVGHCSLPSYTYKVAVAGDLAYVADGDSGLRVVSVADPAHPAVVGCCNTPGRAWGVAVSGNYANVADGDSGLRVIDVSDAAHPCEVAHCGLAGAALDVTTVGSSAYVADGTGGGCESSRLLTR
jgi:hypothetical protein